jgi:hypothetical protein
LYPLYLFYSDRSRNSAFPHHSPHIRKKKIHWVEMTKFSAVMFGLSVGNPGPVSSAVYQLGLRLGKYFPRKYFLPTQLTHIAFLSFEILQRLVKGHLCFPIILTFAPQRSKVVRFFIFLTPSTIRHWKSVYWFASLPQGGISV